MRAKRKRRARAARRAQYIVSWTLVYLFEVIWALLPAMILAVIVVPIEIERRGGFSVGGEWLLICAVFYVAYKHIHELVYRKIYGEEE